MILYNNREVHFGHFPNGESNLRHLPISVLDTTHVVTLKYESDADLFHLLLVRKALDFPATLRITYTPYSRMDRESDTYIFSLKVFTDFINSMYWEKVVIYEPHSDVLSALLNKVQVVDVTSSPIMQAKINIALGSEYQVCYPDVGAFKRYSDKFKMSNPLIGFKVRDFETGHIKSLSISGFRALDNVAIVDDLCSKGGTFVLAAERLRAMGFKKIVLAVAHCENTVYEGRIFGLIDKIITTDSILDGNKYPDKLSIIPLTDFKYT